MVYLFTVHIFHFIHSLLMVVRAEISKESVAAVAIEPIDFFLRRRPFRAGTQGASSSKQLPPNYFRTSEGDGFSPAKKKMSRR